MIDEIRHVSGTGAKSRHAIYRDRKLVGLINRFSHLTGWEITSSHYGHRLRGNIATLDHARKIAATLTYPTEQQVFETLTAIAIHKRRTTACAAEGLELARLLRNVLDNPSDPVVRNHAERILQQIDQFTDDHTRYHFQDNPSPWDRYDMVRRHIPHATELYWPRPPGQA